MDAIGGTSDLSRLRRLPELGSYDRAVIYPLLDATSVCHVGTIVDRTPLVLPSLHVRDGDSLLIHGSRSSRLLRSMIELDRVCVTVTQVDGLIVARSSFNSSVAYRSVTVFGPATLVEGDEERRRVLDLLIDGILPGRSSEVRASTPSELRRTMVLRVAIEEASAKISEGPPEDDPDDVAGTAWAGVLPQQVVLARPVPAEDGSVGRGEVALPRSVIDRQSGL